MLDEWNSLFVTLGSGKARIAVALFRSGIKAITKATILIPARHSHFTHHLHTSPLNHSKKPISSTTIMKFTIFTILSMMTAVFAAQLPQKNIIVSYDDNVPDSVMDQAMDAIKSAGGMITHEYKLIKSVSNIRSGPFTTAAD